jgi:hypothetical protein
LPLSELTNLPNFTNLLESLEPLVKLRFSVNGKFITILEVNSSILGDSQAILAEIKSQQADLNLGNKALKMVA